MRLCRSSRWTPRRAKPSCVRKTSRRYSSRRRKRAKGQAHDKLPLVNALISFSRSAGRSSSPSSGLLTAASSIMLLMNIRSRIAMPANPAPKMVHVRHHRSAADRPVRPFRKCDVHHPTHGGESHVSAQRTWRLEPRSTCALESTRAGFRWQFIAFPLGKWKRASERDLVHDTDDGRVDGQLFRARGVSGTRTLNAQHNFSLARAHGIDDNKCTPCWLKIQLCFLVNTKRLDDKQFLTDHRFHLLRGNHDCR
jgi:hypothetical protein